MPLRLHGLHNIMQRLQLLTVVSNIYATKAWQSGTAAKAQPPQICHPVIL